MKAEQTFAASGFPKIETDGCQCPHGASTPCQGLSAMNSSGPLSRLSWVITAAPHNRGRNSGLGDVTEPRLIVRCPQVRPTLSSVLRVTDSHACQQAGFSLPGVLRGEKVRIFRTLSPTPAWSVPGSSRQVLKNLPLE